MNSRSIATISLVTAAAIFAATIAVSTIAGHAFALRVAGAPQANGASNQANENGLAGIVANVQANAQVGGICVNALTSDTSC